MVLIRAEIALISLWFERYIAVYLGVKLMLEVELMF